MVPLSFPLLAALDIPLGGFWDVSSFTIHHAISLGMIALSFAVFTVNMAKAGGFDG
jgi:hypothetical protein